MKKTIVRIVAMAVLAVMLLSALPAFAYTILGTLANTTALREKADSTSKVVANAKGQVTINYQNSAETYYNVTITNNGQTATGWVPASAVTGIGRDVSGGTSGSTSTGSTSTSTSTGSTVSGTYTGTLAASTALYDASNKVVANVRGNVAVNYRDAAGSRLYVTANSSTQSVSGWVSASAVSNLKKSGSSITVSSLPTGGGSSGSAAYSAYTSAVSGVSQDRTIYMRPTATSSTSGATKISSAKGATFTLLGESGNFYYASYNGNYGFVRQQDFTISSGSTGSTSGSTGSGSVSATYTAYDKAKTGISQDSTIYMRNNPDSSTKDSNVAVKLLSTTGKAFSLLGENGSWYYAQFTHTNGSTYSGYVRMQDFTVSDGTVQQQQANATTSSTTTSGAPAGVGTKSSADQWGSITVPGKATYPIYGNYTNKAGNLYYYDYANIKSYNYIHTTTAKGSQIQVLMGHNMRDSQGYFHNLHHIQNALRGAGRCEHSKCNNSCSTSTYGTTIKASLDGYNTWTVMCLYEVGPKQSTSILEFNARPWTTTTSNYVNTQLQYARTSGYKGWVNPSVSYTDNGKYMMLITCGDKYDSASNSTAKLYVLLKAAS